MNPEEKLKLKEKPKPEDNLKRKEKYKPKGSEKPKEKFKPEENLKPKEKSQPQEKFKSQSVKSNKIPTIDIKNLNKSTNSIKRVVKEDISEILKKKLCINKNKLEKPRAIKEVQGINNTKYIATETTTNARNQIQKKKKTWRERGCYGK